MRYMIWPTVDQRVLPMQCQFAVQRAFHFSNRIDNRARAVSWSGYDLICLRNRRNICSGERPLGMVGAGDSVEFWRFDSLFSASRSFRFFSGILARVR